MRAAFKKILYALLVLPGVTALVFLMFRGFGDPAKLLIGQTSDKKTTENIRRELNLDQPAWKQFLLYVNDISPLSFYSVEEMKSKDLKGISVGGGNTRFVVKLPYLGRSYRTRKNTFDILADALPATIVLACTAMLFAVFFGVLLGVAAAVNKGKAGDLIAVTGSIAGISAPSFFIAIIMAYLFGYLLHDYTGLNITGSLFEIDEISGQKYLALKNLVLPALTLGLRPLAIITQLTRSSMLDVLDRDFIRTAYAKGLSRTAVVLKHALPNAINPVITAVTGWFADLLAGAFFVEYIFGWNGIGKITVDALANLDYPVVAGAILLSAVIFILVNILADLSYAFTDPRVK